MQLPRLHARKAQEACPCDTAFGTELRFMASINGRGQNGATTGVLRTRANSRKVHRTSTGRVGRIMLKKLPIAILYPYSHKITSYS